MIKTVYCRLSKNCPQSFKCCGQYVDYECFKKSITNNSEEWPCPKPGSDYYGDWPPLHCSAGGSGFSVMRS